ncbi:MAG: ATP-binding cassette domain-containing protein [Clostridiales bacterium]|nr:ATP-binding cassette domain-containing protein [Clostridiales bacterium]
MLLVANGASKRFARSRNGSSHFYAVQPVDFTLEEGRLTCLLGRSGSGKTTFLNMMAGLARPSEGTVTADGRDLYAMDDTALSAFRARSFAVIPQGASGLGALTVWENVLLPWSLRGEQADEAYASALMERLGIQDLRDAFPGELSGGELKRMAIARALGCRAQVLFADEPTADLDEGNTRTVLELLRAEAARGAAVLLVTHEREAERYADVLLDMDAGVMNKFAHNGNSK